MENSKDGLEINNFTEDKMWMFIGDNAKFYLDKLGIALLLIICISVAINALFKYVIFR